MRTANGLHGEGRRAEVVLGDVPNARCLSSRVRGEPRCPLEGGSGSDASRPLALEVLEDVLGALGRPQRVQLMVVIRQGAAASDGDHTRITNGAPGDARLR